MEYWSSFYDSIGPLFYRNDFGVIVILDPFRLFCQILTIKNSKISGKFQVVNDSLFNRYQVCAYNSNSIYR